MRFLVILCMLGLVACGPSARLRTIRATYAVANVSADHLAAYSEAHEAQIVAGATSPDDGRAQLVAWRDRVDHAEKVLATLYRAIAAASILDDSHSLTALVQAAVVLRTELTAIGVTP